MSNEIGGLKGFFDGKTGEVEGSFGGKIGEIGGEGFDGSRWVDAFEWLEKGENWIQLRGEVVGEGVWGMICFGEGVWGMICFGEVEVVLERFGGGEGLSGARTIFWGEIGHVIVSHLLCNSLTKFFSSYKTTCLWHFSQQWGELLEINIFEILFSFFSVYFLFM